MDGVSWWSSRRLDASFSVSLVSLLLALGSVGCGGDGGGRISRGNPCNGPVSFLTGDENGHAEPLALLPGEARAGRIEAAELPADPRGLNTYQAGDFVLANENVALLIEDLRPSDHFNEAGGLPVGVARVSGGALIEPADFGELVPLFGVHAVAPESVTVVEDLARNGRGAAVVRVVGTVRPFAPLPDLFATFLRGDYDGVQVAVDYSLAPGAEHVDVTLHYANGMDVPRELFGQALFTVQANRMPIYVEGLGADVESDLGKLFSFVDDASTSYAWETTGDELRRGLSISNLEIFLSPNIVAPACTVHTEVLARMHIGGPDWDGLLGAISRTRGTPRREVTVHGELADGSPAAGARVHVEHAENGYVSRATLDGNGDATLHVPAGDHTLTGYLDVIGATPSVSVGDADASATLTFPATGTLAVATRAAGTTDPLPSRISVLGLNVPAPSTPASWNEHHPPDELRALVFGVTGDDSIALPPGQYRVRVSRGYEYSLFETDVTIVADQTVNVTAELEHVVDSTDVLCGDFHVHTNRSFDAEDDEDIKVRAAAAEGLEVPLRSDHEWVADFEPLIAELGLEDFLFGVVSLELTTLEYGHFGVFPLEIIPEEHNDGAVDWVGRPPGDVFASVHARTVDGVSPAVIVNHPRDGLSLLAYFNAAGYDAVTGVAASPEFYSDDYDLLEVFNDSSFDENPETVGDWFALLNRGRRIAAVGSSDTHEVYGIPLGYPRTCVQLGMDEPSALRTAGPGALRNALVDGHATVNGGIYIEAEHASGAGLGDTVTAAAASELVRVRVQAPLWVDADELRVYVNGALTETIPLNSGTSDPLNPVVRFDDDVAVPLGGAAGWVVFVASGDLDLSPVHSGRMPFGVTNPIFFTP